MIVRHERRHEGQEGKEIQDARREVQKLAGRFHNVVRMVKIDKPYGETAIAIVVADLMERLDVLEEGEQT